MGSVASSCGAAEPAKPLRNGAGAEIWSHATSKSTIASLARLEAMANVTTTIDGPDGSDHSVAQETGCRRMAYSSVLAIKKREEAQALLAHIFTQALTNNPSMGIGGMLFYDEKESAIVQVLEGPAAAVSALFNDRIKHDPRHTHVKTLWDKQIDARQYEGFGMKLGSNPRDILHGPQELCVSRRSNSAICAHECKSSSVGDRVNLSA